MKDLMKRLDPSFSEKALGFRSFSDFLKAQTDHVEVDEDSNIVQVRPVSRAA
ncbi:OST-HTH/LOTUS domain-containing protein [Listeria monocytogenes]|uniref:OST-HTH/LOTUS domain-containing protein n=1 Tax=Listeria monocytogenes TaxID=1639 RepID=UPI003FA498DE